MATIGILIHEAKIGKEVYYYSWKDRWTNPEPKKTKITGEVYQIGGQPTCMVEDVSGVVALTHLCFEYIPERKLSAKKIRAKERYRDYLRSESSLSFGEWIGCKQEF